MSDNEILSVFKELFKQVIREVLEEQKPVTNNVGAVGVKKAAEFIGMSPSWVNKNKEKLNYYREDTKILFKVNDLQEYLDSKETYQQVNNPSPIRIRVASKKCS